jgi:hypothetical protein
MDLRKSKIGVFLYRRAVTVFLTEISTEFFKSVLPQDLTIIEKNIILKRLRK